MVFDGVTVLDMVLVVAVILVLFLWFLDSKADSQRLREVLERMKMGERREDFLVERLEEVRKNLTNICSIHGTEMHCRKCLGAQGAKAKQKNRHVRLNTRKKPMDNQPVTKVATQKKWTIKR